VAMTQRTSVVGVFNDRKMANDAVDALKRAGFRDDQIGVAGKYADVVEGTETGTEWEEGAIAGILGGAGLGALVGLGILAGVIPAIGPVIAGGTLAMLAANAAGGAAIVGLAGALIGAGVPEEEAHYYENEFKAGRTIVTVKADGRAAEATEILRRFGAYDMHTAGGSTSTAAAYASTAASHATAATAGPACATDVTSSGTPLAASKGAGGKDTIRVHEEKLHAHKTPVQTGEVKVRKEVVTEHQTIDVPVQREEVVIERHAVADQCAPGSEIRAGEEIRIPVKEEQVHVGKQAVVKEEVSVGKRLVTETEHVSGDVRKEKVKVEREGDVDVRATGDADKPRKRT